MPAGVDGRRRLCAGSFCGRSKPSGVATTTATDGDVALACEDGPPRLMCSVSSPAPRQSSAAESTATVSVSYADTLAPGQTSFRIVARQGNLQAAHTVTVVKNINTVRALSGRGRDSRDRSRSAAGIRHRSDAGRGERRAVCGERRFAQSDGDAGPGVSRTVDAQAGDLSGAASLDPGSDLSLAHSNRAWRAMHHFCSCSCTRRGTTIASRIRVARRIRRSPKWAPGARRGPLTVGWPSKHLQV